MMFDFHSVHIVLSQWIFNESPFFCFYGGKDLQGFHQRSSGWWLQTCFFLFYPYLRKWSTLTNIFHMGWNHKVVITLPITNSSPMQIKGLEDEFCFGMAIFREYAGFREGIMLIHAGDQQQITLPRVELHGPMHRVLSLSVWIGGGMKPTTSQQQQMQFTNRKLLNC